MRTIEETRKNLKTQALAILGDFEKIGMDISKVDNFEQFLSDYLNKCMALCSEGKNENIPQSLTNFSINNRSQLGDLLQPWYKLHQPVVTFSAAYKGKIFSEFNVDLTKGELHYPDVLKYAHYCLDLVLLESFINPLLRKCAMEVPSYESVANHYFDGIAENTGYIMMEIIKDNYQDFYKFLTEKKEIPKLEEFKEWMKTKKELKEMTATN